MTAHEMSALAVGDLVVTEGHPLHADGTVVAIKEIEASTPDLPEAVFTVVFHPSTTLLPWRVAAGLMQRHYQRLWKDEPRDDS